MSGFALTKDFESMRSGVFKSKKYLEIRKFGKNEYILFAHLGDSAGEIATFTKEELRAIWEMLSIE